MNARSNAGFSWLLAIALFLIFIGSRAAIIHYAGSSVPLLDEWDGELASVLSPYVRGTLSPVDLLGFFGEHVILFTRLVSLAAFTVSGYWDVVLQMSVNAVLDAATFVGAGYALSRVLPGGWAPAGMIASVLIAAVPMSGDSILMGFQSQFYVLTALSLLSFWLLADAKAWSPRWLVGAACALASYLAMASGAATLAAAAGLQLCQLACGRRRGQAEWLAILALAGAAILTAGLVPQSGQYRPHSLSQLVAALLDLASWPAPAALAPVMILPSALFCLLTLRDRPPLGDARWFNLAAFGWIAAQIVVLAVGRGAAPLANRYVELMLIGVAIHLTSVLWLLSRTLRSSATGQPLKTAAALCLGAWLALLIGSFAHDERHLPDYFAFRRALGETQARHLRDYLASGDPSHLGGVPNVDIPYPDAGRLKALLDAPETRALLPPMLLSRDAPPNGVEALKRAFLANGPVWLGAGAILLVVALSLRIRSRPRPLPPSRSPGAKDMLTRHPQDANVRSVLEAAGRARFPRDGRGARPPRGEV